MKQLSVAANILSSIVFGSVGQFPLGLSSFVHSL